MGASMQRFSTSFTLYIVSKSQFFGNFLGLWSFNAVALRTYCGTGCPHFGRIALSIIQVFLVFTTAAIWFSIKCWTIDFVICIESLLRCVTLLLLLTIIESYKSSPLVSGSLLGKWILIHVGWLASRRGEWLWPFLPSDVVLVKKWLTLRLLSWLGY